MDISLTDNKRHEIIHLHDISLSISQIFHFNFVNLEENLKKFIHHNHTKLKQSVRFFFHLN